MIINGEKVPAFSATTLSLPTSPHDNLEKIIESSREQYSRPRSEVEEEIRETIEASEKYKKELSDSGRLPQDDLGDKKSEPKFVFKSADISSSKSYRPEVTRTKTERKSSSRPLTPQEEFKRLKISPSVAEEKAPKLGLKDLGKLLEEKKSEEKVGNDKREEQPSKKSKRAHKKAHVTPESSKAPKHQAQAENRSEAPNFAPERNISHPNPAKVATPKITTFHSASKKSSNSPENPNSIAKPSKNNDSLKKPKTPNAPNTSTEGYIVINH